jgi:hypothetical protein
MATWHVHVREDYLVLQVVRHLLEENGFSVDPLPGPVLAYTVQHSSAGAMLLFELKYSDLVCDVRVESVV